MTGFEIAGICLLVGIIVGVIGGAWVGKHLGTATAAATSAITRATTLPAGEVAALNAAIAGLGTQLAQHTAAVGTSTNAIVNAVAKIPPPPPKV